MTKGNTIADWIKAGEKAKEFGRTPFFGVFVQAESDDGNVFSVVFDKNTDTPLQGGLITTQQDIETLEALGVEVKK